MDHRVLVTEKHIFKLDTPRYIFKRHRIFRILNNRFRIKNLINSLDGATSFLNLSIESNKSSDGSRDDQGVQEKSRQFAGSGRPLHDLISAIPDQQRRNEKGEP